MDPIGGYSVRGVYELLTSNKHVHVPPIMNLILHKQVPLKVSVFAWQMLRDRLPTKTNLATRGVISPEARYCVAGCGYLEDAQHVFLLCPHFASLWSMVRAWIGFDGVDTQAIHDHFHQFIYYTGGMKARRNFLHLIWLLCSWILWNERNNRLFKNQECTSYQLLKKVKYYSLWWLKPKQVTFVFGTQMWWSILLMCLGIG